MPLSRDSPGEPSLIALIIYEPASPRIRPCRCWHLKCFVRYRCASGQRFANGLRAGIGVLTSLAEIDSVVLLVGCNSSVSWGLPWHAASRPSLPGGRCKQASTPPNGQPPTIYQLCTTQPSLPGHKLKGVTAICRRLFPTTQGGNISVVNTECYDMEWVDKSEVYGITNVTFVN